MFIIQPQQVNDLAPKRLIHRVPVQLHRQDDVLIHIQDRNKVIVLEDKANVAAAEDGELFVVHFRQLFVPDNHFAGSRDYKKVTKIMANFCSLYNNSSTAGWGGMLYRLPQAEDGQH